MAMKGILAAGAVVGLLFSTAAARGEPLHATIRVTEHGVPHILANDYESLGFGAGYAFAESNICEMAGRFVTVRAERALFFGPEAHVPDGPRNRPTNLDSDFFWQRVLDERIAERELAQAAPVGPTAETRALIRGYAAGYNKYIADTGVENIADPRCRGAAWVRPISERDVYLRAMAWNLFRSSANLIPQLVAAAPPSATRADLAPVERYAHATGEPDGPDATPLGSNMVALGREATMSGRGMFFANPHWFWEGPDRWFEAHLTIPGRLNVIGVQTSGVPVIQTGFTETVAWAGTTSTANRHTLYELRLVPGRPTSYYYDGEVRRMTSRTVRVRVRTESGRIETRRHTFWSTHYGLVIADEGMDWTAGTAYAIRDVAYSFRWVSQQFELNHAASARDISEGGRRYMGIGWRNIAAADAEGNVFYGDRTAIPHVTNAMIEACVTSELGRSQLGARAPLPIMDGWRSACEWGSDADSPVPGIFGSSSLPELHRTDYALQSNDTHWLNNARQPLEGFPLIMGSERTPRTLRTRNALQKFEGRLAAGERFDLDSFYRVTQDNNVYSADIWMEPLLRQCQESAGWADVREACDVLARWDRTEMLDSNGALLWRRFISRLGDYDDLFAAPFNAEDPIATPAGLRVEDPRVHAALAGAARDLTGSGMPLDARLREYQYALRGDQRIPIPGGPGETGQYNLVSNRGGWTPGEGYPDVSNGASFLMWMEFTDQGPRGRSVMAFSQSPNPDSPFYSDQTQMFSNGQTKPMRFTEAEIAAAPSLRVYEICSARRCPPAAAR